MVAPSLSRGDGVPRLVATAAYKGAPTAGASVATAHVQHTPPQLFAALPKDFQVVRRQKGSKERKKSSPEDTFFNSINSVPCSSLHQGGKVGRQEGAVGMVQVLAECRFQG